MIYIRCSLCSDPAVVGRWSHVLGGWEKRWLAQMSWTGFRVMELIGSFNFSVIKIRYGIKNRLIGAV